jgi:hypothetical protein
MHVLFVLGEKVPSDEQEDPQWVISNEGNLAALHLGGGFLLRPKMNWL